MATLPFLAAAILMASSVMAQVPTINNTEANYAGTASGDWSNPGNVVGTADNACANMGAVDKVNLTSNFGFTIPVDALITGATANVKASSPGGQSVGVQLASNAAIAPPTLLGTPATLAVFNSASGNCAVTSVTSVGPALATWGNPALTPGIVNAASFGLVFTKLETSTVKVDSICLEIDYTTTVGNATTESCFDVVDPEDTTIRVVKQVVGTAPGDDWAFDGDMKGGFTLPAGGGFEDFIVEPGTFDISETTKEGYAASVQCFIGDAMVASGTDSVSVEVEEGDVAVCTFTNVLEAEETLARFLVTKTYSDGNDDEVQVTLSCNNGLPLEQSFMISEGDPVLFVITQFTDGFPVCVVTETDVDDGYSPSYDDNIETISEESCTYSDVTGGDYRCDITNYADPATFTVNKEWVIEGAVGEEVIEEAQVTIFCNNKIVGGRRTGSEWRRSTTLVGDDDFEVTVDTTEQSAECRAVEDIFQSGVESDSDCGTRTIPAGGSSSCTITNTVFFEGIPTLNQYGMALLALLMLGVGVVGIRRFV